MTKKEKYDLAKWAIQYALENGAQQAAVTISNSKSSSVEVRDKKIDKLEQAIQNSLSIRLYVDNKYSSHSTNRLKKDDLQLFIRQAIEGTHFLSEDEYRTLPDPELYYKGGGKALNLKDAEFTKIDPQDKIDLAFAIENEILGSDERIISATGSYYDGLDETVMVTSNGFEGDSARTFYGLFASVSVRGGDARPEAGWNETSLFFDDLKKKEVGKTALKRALAKIGQQKVASGKMTMIVENKQVGRLLSPLISALNGAAIQQKNSFLVDKLGEKVFSDKLTITDNPFIISGRGSRLFDSEGMATKIRPVIDGGTVKTYFINTYYAKKLGTLPTGGNTTNLVIKTGENNLDGLVEKVKKGILVTGFNGGNSNGSTGDFSFGIDGFLIENGKIVQPVSEMNITGNMVTLWSGISEIGNDVNRTSSWLTPSIVFEGVDFSGI